MGSRTVPSIAEKRRSKRVDCGKLCPEWECTQPYEYEGVWVVGEIAETGDVEEASLQMLTPARRIAEKLETFVEGVIVHGNRDVALKAAKTMIEYGADRVRLVVDERLKTYIPEVYARLIASLAAKRKPDVIFFAATMKGRELAPYVANTLRAGITADCTQFDVDEETGDVLMIRPPFQAILLAYIKTPTRRPQIATARPNVFPLPQRIEGRQGEIIWESVEELWLPKPRTRLLRTTMLKREETPIEKAEYIVAGGRGVATPEGFKKLEELAGLLGGVVAGSRKAVDLGLIPHEKQVGQTGKSVKAKLYIAVGISGAAQHVVGIRECRVVVAINNDPDAPIFKHADYGIVGDWREIIPLLIEELKKRRAAAGKRGASG